jgi:hypothetical protein
MQANINMPATPSFDPCHEPLQPTDSDPNDGALSDAEAEARENQLIRHWYSVFFGSFVD